MATRTRIQSALAIVSVVIVLLAPQPALGSDPYQIGMVAALTGAVADTFAPVYEGANVYFQSLNARGGIGGRPVQILVEDDASDPSRAASRATRLVQQAKVPLLVFSTTSAAYGAVMNLTRTAGVPLLLGSICPKEAYPPADPFVFCSHSFGAIYDAIFAIQFIKETATTPVKLGFVALDVPLSRINMDHAADLASKAGMQVTTKQAIPTVVADYTPFATQLQQAGSNWVFAYGPWTTEIGPFDVLQRQGWKGNYLMWAAQPAQEELQRRKIEQLYALAGNALFSDDLPIHKEIRAAVERYRTTYPVEHMAEGWILGMVLERALRGCGWPCGPRALQGVMNTLEVDLKGLRGGPLVWTPDNHYRSRMYYKVYRWDAKQNRITSVGDWGSVDATRRK